jgi:predicted esterase YcpF (UPF0227 family)
MMLLYLHGFRSSPESSKAQMVAQCMQDRAQLDRWSCPSLPASPAKALALCKELAQDLMTRHHAEASELTVIGSSLGGFYAVSLAEQLGCRAVALNPAVFAPRDLASQVGEHEQYHSNEPFIFLPEHVDELRGMAVTQITQPERYLLIAATGDEVLDWQEMHTFFKGAQQIIVEGDNHGLSSFTDHIDTVLQFAGFVPNHPTTKS